MVKRTNAMMRKGSFLTLALLGVVLFVGCSPKTLDDSRSPYLLWIASISPSQLASDVCKATDPVLGCIELVDDKITVTLNAESKVQVAAGAQVGTGGLLGIVLQRFRITYARYAGPVLNPPAPPPVEGALTAFIPVPGNGQVDIVAVPFSYKNEEPLLSLRDSPFGIEPNELWCVATLEIWATDLSGNPIHVSGQFTARFSDAEIASAG